MLNFQENYKAKLLWICTAGIILLSYVLGVLISQPEIPLSVNGMLTKFSGDSAFSIMSLLGASMMPHNFYLHSSIVRVLRSLFCTCPFILFIFHTSFLCAHLCIFVMFWSDLVIESIYDPMYERTFFLFSFSGLLLTQIFKSWNHYCVFDYVVSIRALNVQNLWYWAFWYISQFILFVLLRMTLIGALCNPFTGILLDLGFSGLLFFFDTTLEL